MKSILFNFMPQWKHVTIGTHDFSLICVLMSLRLQMGLEEALRNLRNYEVMLRVAAAAAVLRVLRRCCCCAAFRIKGVGVAGMIERHEFWCRWTVGCALLCLRVCAWDQQGTLRCRCRRKEEARKTPVCLGRVRQHRCSDLPTKSESEARRRRTTRGTVHTSTTALQAKDPPQQGAPIYSGQIVFRRR